MAELLSRELDEIRSLRAAVEAERRAVEGADANALRRAAELVRDRSRVLADLTRRRDRATTALGLPTDASLEAVIDRLRAAGEGVDAVTRIGGIVRREAREVARAIAVVRHAAERLAAHLSGVRSLVHVGGPGVYGRRGRVASGDGPLAVDLRH